MLHLYPSQLPAITPGIHAEERGILQFCHDWLSGKETFILHTSGSTGHPKPITLTRQQMEASAQMTGQTLGLQAGDTALVCLNTQYIAGTMMLVRGMVLGLEMVIIAPSSNPLLDFSPDTDFSFAALVPLQLSHILTQTPEKTTILNRMKAILVGGAAVSPLLEAQLQTIIAPVYSTYGMTETVSHIALRKLNGPERSEVYTALEGVQLGTDERGCLHITAPCTNNQLQQTNDCVELMSPTSFRWLGRFDNVLNSGGVKIQLEEVEKLLDVLLTQLNQSARAFAFGMPHPELGEKLCLCMERPSLGEAEEIYIKNEISQQLGKYAAPRQFFYLPQFPETPTGKIDRQEIKRSLQYMR